MSSHCSWETLLSWSCFIGEYKYTPRIYYGLVFYVNLCKYWCVKINISRVNCTTEERTSISQTEKRISVTFIYLLIKCRTEPVSFLKLILRHNLIHFMNNKIYETFSVHYSRHIFCTRILNLFLPVTFKFILVEQFNILQLYFRTLFVR